MTDSANSTSTIFNHGPHTSDSDGPVHQRTIQRGPIQVTLEDNMRTQYKPQVKILRRPRPAADAANQAVDSNHVITTTFNNNNFDAVANNTSAPGHRAGLESNAFDAKTTTTSYSNVLSRNNNASSAFNSRTDDYGQSNTNARTVINNSNSNKTMRTYQERADEYAKARLRILGSAFPLDDADNNVQ